MTSKSCQSILDTPMQNINTLHERRISDAFPRIILSTLSTTGTLGHPRVEPLILSMQPFNHRSLWRRWHVASVHRHVPSQSPRVTGFDLAYQFVLTQAWANFQMQGFHGDAWPRRTPPRETITDCCLALVMLPQPLTATLLTPESTRGAGRTFSYHTPPTGHTPVTNRAL